MSYYSDWQSYGIDDEQYTAACNREAAADDYEGKSRCHSCRFYKWYKLGYNDILKKCTLDEGCIYDDDFEDPEEEDEEQQENKNADNAGCEMSSYCCGDCSECDHRFERSDDNYDE